ncbi:putative Tumor suppressor candidate [Tripterygium wilfordii]|uniref:Putative Tumor suppressor candidate n=1 Tax=Tripterygium wilfordii TaxID=458696 RepID=A0A7J7C4C9_TRIWF|nr:putative Tumor suppressor candidate [Tripterygium wilfordii]
MAVSKGPSATVNSSPQSVPSYRNSCLSLAGHCHIKARFLEKSTLLFFMIFCSLFHSLYTSSVNTNSEIEAELLSLRARSDDSVIHLNDLSVSRFLTSTKPPRSYYLIIFFDATHLHGNLQLNLQDFRHEFSLVASSFIANNEHDSSTLSKVFFCDIEFSESQSSFDLFGVVSAPHIGLVGPNVNNLKDADRMGRGDIRQIAESMAEFVESKTKVMVGPIHRPPSPLKNQLVLILVLLLILAPFLTKKVMSGETLLQNPKIWFCGAAVCVYFFSVSGAMYNIIHKMPMFLVDPNDPSELIFFHQGSGTQLGAEGFAVGFLYTVVGLVLALITHVFVTVKNVIAQWMIMIISLLISIWAVGKVVYLDDWKKGYM